MLEKKTMLSGIIDLNVKDMNTFRRDASAHISFLTKRLEKQHQALQRIDKSDLHEEKFAEMNAKMEILQRQNFALQNAMADILKNKHRGASGPSPHGPGMAGGHPPTTPA